MENKNFGAKEKRAFLFLRQLGKEVKEKPIRGAALVAAVAANLLALDSLKTIIEHRADFFSQTTEQPEPSETE